VLTLFTIPKAFSGRDGVIQRNALRSWRRLEPRCQILVFGDDPGVGEAAEEFDLTWVPEVEKTDYGTPLLNGVFRRAQELAEHRVCAYVNADIVLLSDFIPAVNLITLDRFLMVGRRWDVDVDEALDPSANDFETGVRRLVQKSGRLHAPSGMDYFVFPGGTVNEMPPFAVGRPSWDNWLISRMRLDGVPVIDGTGAVTAVHQNHDYGHVAGRTGAKWEGSPEAVANRNLSSAVPLLNIEAADYRLTAQGLAAPRLTLMRLGQLALVFALRHPSFRWPISLALSAWRAAKAKAAAG
jgi:hypothetical protein